MQPIPTPSVDARDIEAQNKLASLPALAPVVLSLTFLETVELLRRLNGGTAGFNTNKYRLAELRAILAGWVSQGYPPAPIESHAFGIVAGRAAKAAPSLPPPPPVAASGVAPVAPAPVAPLAAAIADAEALIAPAPVAIAVPEAGALPDSMQPAPFVPAPSLPAALAPVAAPVEPSEADTIAAALQETARTHPAAMLPPEVAAPAPERVAPAGRAFARELFKDCPPALTNLIPADLTVPMFAHPDAEQPNPSYRFNIRTLLPTLIAMAATPTLRVWNGGPRGTGKTEFCRQIAARTGRAFFRVNFHRHSEASDIIGDMGLKGGDTAFAYGPVALAAQVADGAALLLLDEPTYCAPGSLSSLNPILERDGATLRLRTGEKLPIHPMLFIVAADNTFGTGDTSGEYHGRQEIGADTRDRFGVKLSFDYLPEADEKALLRECIVRETGRKPAAPILAALLKIMHVAREKAGMGELQGAPSFRGASAFAVLMAYGMSAQDAYAVTVIAGSPEESHEALRQIFASHWPTDAAGNLIAFIEG